MLGFRICVFVTVLYAAAALKLQEKQTQEQLPVGTEILNKRLMSNGEKARAFASILPTIIEENEKFQQQGQEQLRQEQQEAAEAATEEEAAVDEATAPVARDCHEYVDGSWEQTRLKGEGNCAYYYYTFEEISGPHAAFNPETELGYTFEDNDDGCIHPDTETGDAMAVEATVYFRPDAEAVGSAANCGGQAMAFLMGVAGDLNCNDVWTTGNQVDSSTHADGPAPGDFCWEYPCSDGCGEEYHHSACLACKYHHPDTM